MVSSIRALLNGMGYKNFMLSQDLRYASFVMEENYYLNVLCFFDERTAVSSDAQMDGFVTYLKEKLSCGRDKDVHFLRVICADSAYIVQRCDNRKANEWYIETGTSKLIVPEWGVEDFYGLRGKLEILLAESGFDMGIAEAVRADAEGRQGEAERRSSALPVGKSAAAKTVYDSSAVTWLTFGLIIANVVMYIMQTAGIVNEDAYVLTNDIIGKPLEWYRFLTYGFLHGSIAHIVNNMIVLYAAGSALEKMSGRIAYTVVYFVSLAAGGVFSVWYHTNAGILYTSLGASGAIYGLTGGVIAGILMLGYMRRRESVIRVVIAVALLFIPVNASDGATVDFAAHLGGFVAGFVLEGVILIIMSLLDGKKEKR
ncbi:MAG: rhomboid family intramembrane serine protease [Lachnospiraceae bacterium]|nr:rhomboid family intramembrane serine protease [Lachnospiraceae bacterium]